MCQVIMMLILAIAVFICGVSADYDKDMGTKLTDMNIQGQSCPVYAISHNTLHLDCQINTNGLMFSIDSTDLTQENMDGKTFLALRQTYSLPYKRSYNINVKQNGEMIASAQVPSNKMVPIPMVVPGLSTEAYEVGSGRITILNDKTIFIPRFNYNGKGPDAFFWVGQGNKPDSNGIIVPDEKGSKEVLGKYDQKDILLNLPEGTTIHDIDYLSVWCRAYAHDFGHVMFPEQKMVPPSSYKPQVMDFSELVLKAVPSDSATSSSIAGTTYTAAGIQKQKDDMDDDDDDDDNASSSLASSSLVLVIAVIAALH